MEEFQQRVMDEHMSLFDKVEKLNEFFKTETFTALSGVDKALLVTQFHAMQTYLTVLHLRISQFPASNGLENQG